MNFTTNSKSSLRINLFLRIMLLLFMFSLIILGIIYFIASDILSNKYEEDSIASLEQSIKNIEILIRSEKEKLTLLSSSEEFKSLDNEEVIPFMQTQMEESSTLEALALSYYGGLSYLHNEQIVVLENGDYMKYAFQGHAGVSELIKSPLSGKDVIVITVPIKEEGRVLAVLSALIRTETIAKLSSLSQTSLNNHVFIMNSKGDYIIKPSIPDLSLKHLFEAESSDNDQTLDKIIAREQGIEEIQIEKNNYYLSFIPLGISDWFIFSLALEKDIYKPLRDFFLALILAMIITYLLIGALVWFYLKKSLSPLKQLAENSTKLVKNKANEHIAKAQFLNEIDIIDDSLNRIENKFDEMIEEREFYTSKIEDISKNILDILKQEYKLIPQRVRVNFPLQLELIEKLKYTEINNNLLQQLENNIRNYIDNSTELYRNSVYLKKHFNSLNNNLREQDKDLRQDQDLYSETKESIRILYSRTRDAKQRIFKLDQLSEKTNLLAFHAAVEAGRTGDTGRNFAEIAEELRTLAEESSKIISQLSSILQDLDPNFKELENSIIGLEFISNKGSEFRLKSIKESDQAEVALREFTYLMQNPSADIDITQSLLNEISEVFGNIVAIGEAAGLIDIDSKEEVEGDIVSEKEWIKEFEQLQILTDEFKNNPKL